MLDVARLNVKTAEPFSAGQISQATGFLSGRLDIAGTTSAPQVRGQLTTSPDASFVVPQLGSPFRLVSQPITFDAKGIAFNNFTVLDSAGNKAVANGYVPEHPTIPRAHLVASPVQYNDDEAEAA